MEGGFGQACTSPMHVSDHNKRQSQSETIPKRGKKRGVYEVIIINVISLRVGYVQKACQNSMPVQYRQHLEAIHISTPGPAVGTNAGGTA